MRKSLVLLLALFTVARLSGVALAGVDNSEHDFAAGGGGLNGLSSSYAGDPRGQLCRVCHVPHNTLKGTGAGFITALLWRQSIHTSEEALVWSSASYWYTGWRPSYNAGVSPANYAELDYGTKRCMGCHDGGSFYVFTGAADAQQGVKLNDVDSKITDLKNVHPVGIKYVQAYSLSEFRTVDQAATDGIRFVDKTSGGAPAGGSEYLGCGSCHDPHNGNPTYGQFLRVQITGSSLCRACHVK